MNLISWTISLVLIGLFTIAVLGFAIQFSNVNEAPVNIANDPNVSKLYTDMGGGMTNFTKGANSTYTSIVQSSVSSGQTTTQGGHFAITPLTMIYFATGTSRLVYSKIFGSDSGFSIFFTSFLALLGILAGYLIWKAWIGRDVG